MLLMDAAITFIAGTVFGAVLIVAFLLYVLDGQQK